MYLSAIVAMSENRVIGRNNQLPWRLPADLRHFKAITLGKPVLMGRKTYDSIGRPLPGRQNIVLTRDPALTIAGCDVVTSVEEALAVAGAAPELCIIGGAQLYSEMLPRIQRLYLTIVHANCEGDAYFPEINPADWHETARERHAADAENAFDFSFVTLER